MSDVYTDDLASEQHQIFLHNYLHLVGMIIFYYDYSLTFGDEYARIWKQRGARGNYPFYVNRYLTFFGDIAVNVGNFYNFKTTRSCNQYSFYRQALLIGAQVVVCIILFLRTSALYSRNKYVAGLILVVGFSLAGLAIYAVIGQHSSISLIGGCHAAASHITCVPVLRGLAVAWECLFVFDCMIFSLTMYKTWKQRLLYPLRRDKLNLASLISRDGAVYFAVMASANLANTLTFYFLQPLLRGALSTVASSVSVTMMSRFMLNLHESAGINSTLASPSSSDNSTTLLFTSRIDMQSGDILTVPIPESAHRQNPRDIEMAITDDVLDLPEEIEMVTREK
ncbi:hypothetical protein DAEQUDRAFT_718948 [Daedalea quercina L-15889]|uniref:DUF6533 domain-containing protein n=1 Tax=Daedalea quercina L-15889 TaxID=1314783 RepID=A0A165L0E2_9APHY|nr:hypothetical protein DAEQUDRAFT_718948 [Daedalea quercina L-15889]